MIMHMAEFWASRAIYNDSSGFYDIRSEFNRNIVVKKTVGIPRSSIDFIVFVIVSDVMGPDEDNSNVTNSAFTNVVAGYALYLGE